MENLKCVTKHSESLHFKQNNSNSNNDNRSIVPNITNKNVLYYTYDTGTRNGKCKVRQIVRQLIDNYKSYKYTVYRCAAKIVALQKVLYTCYMPYKLVLAVMEHHNIQNSDPHLMVPPYQLTSLFYDIYQACKTLGYFHHSVDMATTNLAEFFWDVYDSQRRYSISIIEIKLTLIVLCKSFTSHQLITEIYKVIASSSKHQTITKLNLEAILNILIKLVTYLDEGSAYGQHNLHTIIEQCFAKYNGTIDITEQQFQNLWHSSQTLFSIYGNLLALVKRMEDAEKLIHNNSCAACHYPKIVGIRFRCHLCKNYSLCLNCFATGGASICNRNSNSYKKYFSNHKFYEIYTEDVSHNKSMICYVKQFCLNLFCLTNNFRDDDKDGNTDSQEIMHVKDSLNSNDITELVAVTISPTTINSSTRKNNNNTDARSNAVKDAATSLNVIEQNIRPSSTIIMKSKSDVHLNGLATTACNALNVSEKLQIIIDKLLLQNSKLEHQLKRVQCSTTTPDEISEFLDKHQQFLLDLIQDMRSFSVKNFRSYPIASTPHRFMLSQKPSEIDDFSVVTKNNPTQTKNRGAFSFDNNKERLSLSIYGSEINRSYLDANKSDYSLNDLTLWFNRQSLNAIAKRSISNNALSIVPELPLGPLAAETLTSDIYISPITTDTNMSNFKLLLNKVKEIVEDSYSDNMELTEATQNLENVLDAIIKSEESLRKF